MDGKGPWPRTKERRPQENHTLAVSIKWEVPRATQGLKYSGVQRKDSLLLTPGTWKNLLEKLASGLLGYSLGTLKPGQGRELQ